MIPPHNPAAPRRPENTPAAPSARPHPAKILLVDCDTYYVQIAQQQDPEGLARHEYIIVGGREDGRGVVTSASYACRRYGIRSGIPVDQALRLCPQAIAVPPDMEAAVRKNAEISVVIERFTPLVEIASVDEFFVDLSGTELLYRNEPLEITAQKIRQAILEETGIRVSIGGGTQRTIAKMASSLAKPSKGGNGVYIVPAGQEQEFMKRWDLADIPYVGPAFTAELLRRGLRSVEDALALDERLLIQWLGETKGHWLAQRIRGIDYTPVSIREDRKSIGTEKTFSYDIEDTEGLENELLVLVQEVGAMLRDRGMRARNIAVSMRCSDFSYYRTSRTLPESIDSDRAIFRIARQLLAILRDRRWSTVRLVGISVGRLSNQHGTEQLLLFESPPPLESSRDRAIARARDQLRHQFGKEVVHPGRILLRKQAKNPPEGA